MCSSCRWRWRPRKFGRPPLFQARTIALVAALLAFACAFAVVPLVALGDDAPATTGPSAEVAELVEVREQVEAVNEEAREQAPPAVGATCGATLDVEGIGDACIDPNGMIRVEQADGRSHTIHGMDAPPTGASAFAPVSQSAVNGATASDIACVGADAPHYVLVYAHPGNVASRYSTVAPALRQEAYKMSAFIDTESRSVDPAAGRRLPMRCEGGTPVVLQASLSGLTAGTATFGNIVDGLRAQGYEFNGSGSGKQRYVVYYDAPSPTGAAGTGHVFTKDTSAGATNQNNKGGLFAVEYRFDQGGGMPHWEVLVHEVMHTMGAVVETAPHSTGAGAHCTDGQDVMCYADGSGASYNAGVCATKVLDCNRDDYFHPAPAAGSYLATHWNAAASYNAWLQAGGVASTPPTGTAGGLLQTGASDTAISVSWTATSGAGSYVVSVRTPGATWREVLTTSRTAATISGLFPSTTYEVGVAARSAAGALGAQATLTVSTSDQADVVAPAKPRKVVARTRASQLTFTWADGGDNVGVTQFELRQVTQAAGRRSLRSAGSTPNTTLTIPTRGLRAGVAYRFEVVARDAASNVSAPTAVVVRIAADRARPTAPAHLRAAKATRSAVTLAWNPSRDNVGVARYELYQQVGRRWVKLGARLGATSRTVTVTRLRARSTYVFRLQARDAAGNLSAASLPLRARTR